MNKVALVLTYIGKEPSDIIKSHICEEITRSGFCDCNKEVAIYFVTEKEMIQAVAAKAVMPKVSIISEHFYKEGLSDLEEALITIAKHCPTLEATSDVHAFEFELAYRFAQAFYLKKDIDLIEAVRKVSKTYPEISIKREIASRYHYDLDHYKAIKQVSDSYV